MNSRRFSALADGPVAVAAPFERRSCGGQAPHRGRVLLRRARPGEENSPGLARRIIRRLDAKYWGGFGM
jgi:hypothetical protein